MEPNELQELDSLEQADEIDVNAWMEAFLRAYAKPSPERRAYSLIRAFFRIDSPSEKEYRMFIGWLVNGNNTKAKYEALGKVFEEVCEQTI
jgi:hypothetical protein